MSGRHKNLLATELRDVVRRRDSFASNLFPDEDLAYSGYFLDVTQETHEQICQLFPDLAIAHEYRAADSWLLTCPRKKLPKNHKRFLMNWFRKSANREHKTLQQERDLQIAIHAGEQR
jgi:hypothetical protein